MRKANDLDTLRERHLISGRDVGAGQCIWANDFAIRTVANKLNLCVHIMDEESGRARSNGSGRKLRRRSTDEDGESCSDASSSGVRPSGTFVTIRPEIVNDNDNRDRNHCSEDSNNVRHICLQRTRRQHFNLSVQRFEGGGGGDARYIFDELPQKLQELWGFGESTSTRTFEEAKECKSTPEKNEVAVVPE